MPRPRWPLALVMTVVGAALILALLAASASMFFGLRRVSAENAALQQQIKDLQIGRQVREGAEKAEKTGQPQPVTIDLTPFLRTIAGLSAEIASLRVEVERERNAPPGKTPGITAKAPPVNLPSDAAAKAAAEQADQRVEVDWRIDAGTVFHICLVELRDGACPNGQERALPTSRAVTGRLTLIRPTPGVFTALSVPGAVVTPVETRTTTRDVAPEKVQASPRWHIEIRPGFAAVFTSQWAAGGPALNVDAARGHLALNGTIGYGVGGTFGTVFVGYRF